MSCVLQGENLVDFEGLKVFSVSDTVCNKYARKGSCDVEHIYSKQITFPW